MPVRLSGARQVLLVALVAALGVGGVAPLRAQDAVVVLSSSLSPYREALAGFEQAMGHPVPVADVSEPARGIGPDTRVVVAFGGRAAVASYPAHVALVYCMAPGATLPAAHRSAPTCRISLLPQPRAFLAVARRIQPELRRLGVLWCSLDVGDDYLEQLVSAAGEYQVEVLSEPLQSADELPERLRGLVRRKAEALWLLPDPLLVNPGSVAAIRDFSVANDVAFYAPTSGIAQAGATASVAPSFGQIGREAAEMALRILQGEAVEATVYPHEFETTISLSAARDAGLRVPESARATFDRVLP